MSKTVHFTYKGVSWDLERTVFRYGFSDPAMPKVIIISAMHGNEPSGLMALLELKPQLRALAHKMKGEVIGLIGNFKALERSERYLDTDLNRMWKSGTEGHHGSELTEKQELAEVLNRALIGTGARYVLDLHTTSADSLPFMSIADTILNRAFASSFAIPAIAGIERFIQGALLEHVSDLGHVGLAFEAGQHQAAHSVKRHEEFIMEALDHSGVLEMDSPKSIKEGEQYDIIYRHGITEEDQFIMSPGYENLSPIHKGQVLGRDKYGEVHAPKDGLLFMPLYQTKGNDGFFIIR